MGPTSPEESQLSRLQSYLSSLSRHDSYFGSISAIPDKFGGFTVITNTNIQPYGLVMRIPLQYCISAQDSYCANIISVVREIYDASSVPSRACFMWYIAALREGGVDVGVGGGGEGEEGRGGKGAYVRSIIGVNQAGCSWGLGGDGETADNKDTAEEGDDIIKGTNLEDSVRRMNLDSRVWYDRIKEAISKGGKALPTVSWETWDWANGVYHSRGFPSHLVFDSPSSSSVGSSEDYCGCLIPVMDLTNHVMGEEVEWRRAEGGVELRAGGQGIKAGEREGLLGGFAMPQSTHAHTARTNTNTHSDEGLRK